MQIQSQNIQPEPVFFSPQCPNMDRPEDSIYYRLGPSSGICDLLHNRILNSRHLRNSQRIPNLFRPTPKRPPDEFKNTKRGAEASNNRMESAQKA
jgi:hypothetical protein